MLTEPLRLEQYIEPDFLLVCKDDRLSYSQWYGIYVHRNVFWKKAGAGIGAQLEKGPGVGISPAFRWSDTDMVQSNGFQFGHQPICVLHTIIAYLYTGELEYHLHNLPLL